MMIKTIRGLLLGASIVFSVSMLLGAYYAISAFYERAVRDAAVSDANAFAEMTFNTMFQVMSKGWNRDQLNGFVGAVRDSVANTQYQIAIHRGRKVDELFGKIDAPAPDERVLDALERGEPLRLNGGDEVRYVFPLKAKEVCQGCHSNAVAGEVLGVIDVRRSVAPLIEANKQRFMLTLLPGVPFALGATLLLMLYINRRIRRAIEKLEQDIGAINRVSDLKNLDARSIDFGFGEFAPVSREIEQLTDRLRRVAVDKDMLEFEIRLLEKFIITSEVVRDWREYVNRLLIEINSVMEAYALFSIFKIGDDSFSLEVFWRNRPSEETRRMFERNMTTALKNNPYFADNYAVHVEHNVADPSSSLPPLSEEDIELQTKSLLVTAPKIGGIVGIGVHAELGGEPTRRLVIDSVLSTLLNVVGSVKAIHKFTKDLEYYATRDPLTNLYNQRVFWELLDNEIVRAARHNYEFSLLVLDADNFKSINDTYGHSFGDIYLQRLSAAVRGAIRGDDMLARYGGDELAVILPESSLVAAEQTAARILQAANALSLDAPGGGRVTGSVSIGMATYPEHAVEKKDLFLFADNMMYRAKSNGKNRYAVPTVDDMVEVFRTLGEKSIIILNAVDERRLVPYFQPILGMRDNRVEAVEVLSRIQLEGDRVMAADEFVAIAEKMGVMHKLDYILMEKALDTISRDGYEGTIFLNMSPRALVLNDFIHETRSIASAFKVDPSRIVFEITERETIKNMVLLEKFIRSLKYEGFGLAIDDFGSGFSSFHYIKRFPIDYLKIEGDFIVGMASNDKDRALVRSIVSLAKDLGIRTVAEYVEDRDVFDAVRAQGIDLAQGYYISRPRPHIDRAPPPL